MNKDLVDQLIQYILLVASHEDEQFYRELGPIHIIKYLFLADLDFAETHLVHAYSILSFMLTVKHYYSLQTTEKRSSH